MLTTRKSFFAVLIALFVLAGFGIASAASIGGLRDNTGILPLSLDNYVNPGGVGDTLIYNYYNARQGNTTFFTVTNTDSANGIRARVRLREAADVAENGVCNPEEPRGSFEVLDFDICLSKNDMWTGFVAINPSDPNGGAMLCSMDTDTLIWDGASSGIFPSNCVPLKYGAANIVTGITAENTQEGYIEIIGERTMEADGGKSISDDNGCNPVNDTNIGAPTNSLFGNAAILGVGPFATSFTYDATAIANFAGGDIADSPTTSLPTLASGQDLLAGVNFILTKRMLFSVYDLVGSQTEFIVTFPTKALTQACGADNDIFDDDRATIQMWNDQEKPTTGTGCAFSPCPGATEDSLPFEVVAILPKSGNSIMDSEVEVLPLVPTPYDFGWFSVDLDKALTALVPDHVTIVDNVSTFGWPSLGLTLLDVDNGASSGTFSMQFTTDVR